MSRINKGRICPNGHTFDYQSMISHYFNHITGIMTVKYRY